MKRQGKCEKCGTTMVELFEYNERNICKANACYQEEVEKDSGKYENEEAKLEEYRNLIAGTKNVIPSEY